MTHWLINRQQLAALASLIGQADALMLGEPSLRRAFLKNVRFDAAPEQEVEHGLSLASLELSSGDRRALKLLPWLPNWLLHISGATRVFAANARRLVDSASGICIIIAPDTSHAADLSAGRAMQRAWLALTQEGLAAQPMMSLPVLENLLHNANAPLIASLGRDRLQSLLGELRGMAPEISNGRPAFLMRFGYAPPPTGRTGRLPLAAVAKFN